MRKPSGGIVFVLTTNFYVDKMRYAIYIKEKSRQLLEVLGLIWVSEVRKDELNVTSIGTDFLDIEKGDERIWIIFQVCKNELTLLF